MVERIQVIDVLRLNLGMEAEDNLMDYYETSNGSYKRYYPNRPNYQTIKRETRELLDQKLKEIGTEISPDEYFYVLLYFSW